MRRELTQAEKRLGLYSALRARITTVFRSMGHFMSAVAVTLTRVRTHVPHLSNGPMTCGAMAFAASDRSCRPPPPPLPPPPPADASFEAGPVALDVAPLAPADPPPSRSPDGAADGAADGPAEPALPPRRGMTQAAAAATLAQMQDKSC